jgi:hypothetical protein
MSGLPQLVAQLKRHGLLTREFLDDLEDAPAPEEGAPRKEHRPAPPHLEVLRMCSQRALVGGLSIALDVRPDELLGTLCAALGGVARELKIRDVRDGPPLELRVAFREVEERWELEDLYVFVENVNDLFREEPSVRACALLGEWDDMLHVWCLEKQKLPALFREAFFAPRNRHTLQRMVEAV